MNQKSLVTYVARERGSSNDKTVAFADNEHKLIAYTHGGFLNVQRILPAWNDLVRFLPEEVQSPGKKMVKKQARSTKLTKLALSDGHLVHPHV